MVFIDTLYAYADSFSKRGITKLILTSEELNAGTDMKI
jgi:hypothetical protein